jgi:hypothetical protein
MLIPNHPDDERLSALASRDDDATTDAALTSHVSTCVRCTETVTELGALRASLAELPDLVPSRPLRLLPPVADAPAAGIQRGWIRRLFAPAMTAGAALAMVGVIGTASPALQGMASSGQDSALEAAGGEGPASSFAQVMRSSDAYQQPGEGGEPAGAEESPEAAPADGEGQPLARESEGANDDRSGVGEGDDDGLTTLPAERSPWPMVLFTGIALMVGAALLRWILVPRTG